MITAEKNKIRELQRKLEEQEQMEEDLRHERFRAEMVQYEREEVIKELKQTLEESERLRLEAEKANQAKTDFLNMMSHELRTPLTVVMANLSELKSPGILEGEEEIKEIAADAHKQAQHLLGLIEEMLDLAKIEAGKMEISVAPLPIADLMDEVVNAVKPLADNKRLTLKVNKEELIVRGDRKRLRQVFLNLLSNAVKFTDYGGITVGVRKNENVAVFSVRDTGIGIPEDKIGAVFEPFEQVDNSSTRRAGGTGLGLPITRELVRLHDGKITMKSEVGKGTVFTFTIPLA